MQEYKKEGISLFNPLIGGLSNINMLAVVENMQAIVCKQNQIASMMFMLGFIMFGPFLVFMVISEPQKVHAMPFWMATLLVLFIGFMDILLLNAALRNPRIVLDKMNKTLAFYVGLSKKPRHFFKRDDIASLEKAFRIYRSKGHEYPNYILLLKLKNNEEIILTCTTDEKLSDQYEKTLRTWLSL